MLQFLLNPWMLLGLMGVALPIIAHLLSRRRFDVVEWGAMQFLNPSRKTRRRLKLEELLLLLLRMGLITVVVLAVTRPIVPSGWFSGYHSAGSRTVVLIIDGSNSMARSDGVNSVHQNAVRRATEFLQTLGTDDSVALIDARDQPKSVIESPLLDRTVVEEQIRKLRPPGGACAILPALEKAIGILGRSSSSAREIVVFADRQAQGWKSGAAADWARIDDLLKFPSIRPQIWMVDAAPNAGPIRRNFSVGRIEMSREMSVPDFPLQLRVAIRNNSDAEAQVPVRLLLDGQALAGETQNPVIPARSEVALEFDHSVRSAGSHVFSVQVEASEDAIAVDNISHAAVHVADSLQLLLVNGTPSSVAADRDTFFAELAFAPPEGKPPWVNARVVEAADLKPKDFTSAAAVVMCNVQQISRDSATALAAFVQQGNGLIIACGPNTSSESFQECFVDSGLLSSLEIVRTRDAPPQAEEQIRVAPLSIQPGWLERFRSDPARSFLKATFTAWSLTKIAPRPISGGPNNQPESATDGTSPRKQSAPDPGQQKTGSGPPVVLAQLSTGDPLILQARHGNGFVVLLTSTLDRTWNDLPARGDFLPFLYEAVFHVASSRSHRNVAFAEPLIARFATPDTPASDAPESQTEAGAEGRVKDEVIFTLPDTTKRSMAAVQGSGAVTAVLPHTFSPGVYRAEHPGRGDESSRDVFVVNYDHLEDEPAALTEDDKALLITNDRVRFSSTLEDLTKRMYGSEAVTELWAGLMTVFLLFLISELLLTRRAIRRGYGGESMAAG